jgi:hypothetical protein
MLSFQPFMRATRARHKESCGKLSLRTHEVKKQCYDASQQGSSIIATPAILISFWLPLFARTKQLSNSDDNGNAVEGMFQKT